MNLEYLEKLRDEVKRITGKNVSYSIPRGFLDRSADEIVVVDAPARESISRGMASADRPRPAEERKLSRLRELALLVAAGVVDRQLETSLRSHGMDQHWGVQERILVCVTPRSNATQMLESGRRNADSFQGKFYVVYVQQPVLSEEDQSTLQQNLDYAHQLGAKVETLTGPNVEDAIVNFARENGITQLFVGHSVRKGLGTRIFGSPVGRLIRAARGIDVRVFPH